MDDTFTPGVQYGDWKGASKADNSDMASLHMYLTDKGLLKPGEFIVGIQAYNGENHAGRALSPFRVEVYIVEAANLAEAQRVMEHENPKARKIHLEMSANQFFEFFKRFSVTLGHRSLDISDREFDVKEDAHHDY